MENISKFLKRKNVISEKGCYQQNVGTINYHRKAKIQNKRKQVINEKIKHNISDKKVIESSQKFCKKNHLCNYEYIFSYQT